MRAGGVGGVGGVVGVGGMGSVGSVDNTYDVNVVRGMPACVQSDIPVHLETASRLQLGGCESRLVSAGQP